MIRLSRAGRKRAVIDAIRQLDAIHSNEYFTKGEICKKMGIKSTSRIRDLLAEMLKDDQLIGHVAYVNRYGDPVMIYQIPVYRQMEFDEHRVININGVMCWNDGTEVNFGDLPF